MRNTGYQVLGFAVWNGAKWYVRRRYGRTLAVAGAGAALLAAGAGAALAARRTQQA